MGMSPNPKKRVLIADDDKDLCACLEHALVEKYEVIKVYDGVSGLAMAMKYLPDLVLLDITMPKMSGYQMMDMMKRNPQLKDVPVIFVTAKTSPQDTAFAMKKGAVGYITKPFDIEKLIEMIDKTLNPPPQPEQTPAQ